MVAPSSARSNDEKSGNFAASSATIAHDLVLVVAPGGLRREARIVEQRRVTAEVPDPRREQADDVADEHHAGAVAGREDAVRPDVEPGTITVRVVVAERALEVDGRPLVDVRDHLAHRDVEVLTDSRVARCNSAASTALAATSAGYTSPWMWTSCSGARPRTRAANSSVPTSACSNGA